MKEIFENIISWMNSTEWFIPVLAAVSLLFILITFILICVAIGKVKSLKNYIITETIEERKKLDYAEEKIIELNELLETTKSLVDNISDDSELNYA